MTTTRPPERSRPAHAAARQRASGAPRLAGAIAIVLALGVAWPARAVVPPAERVIEAVSAANRAAGRATTLRIGLAVVRGEDEVVGSGDLLSDPSGDARLELRAGSGLVERHLRRRGEYQASRNAIRLPTPDPLLPPLGVLQAATAQALGAALLGLGAAPGQIVLGHAAERDCYVLGGRLPGPDRGEPPLHAAFWVDLETLEPVRIDGLDGVRYRFGPPTLFGDIRLPGWLAIQRPGQQELRLVLRGARAERAGPDAFDPAWLTAGGMASGADPSDAAGEEATRAPGR